MDVKREKLLDRLYKDLNSPICYTSLEPLLREAKKHDEKISRKIVSDYLARQDVYTLHRRVVRRYRRLHTLAPGLHTEWQADLAVMDRLAAKNRGYKYFLVCIDTLSRQLFVEPVKSKHAVNMINAFRRIFKQSKYIPWKLLTDQGKEFTAKRVQDFFKSINMEHFCMLTSPQFHAGMAERANRSIKERLYRYFTEKKTQKWVAVIHQIVRALNYSPNSSIGGLRPVDINFENAEQIRSQLAEHALAEEQGHSRINKFKVGDMVRIEKFKHVFEKGYLPNFTSELFVVDRVRKDDARQPITYGLCDKNGEQIKGWFYGHDLCRVLADSTAPLYDIEKIIRKQKRHGHEFVYVKWKGFGTRHNSWIPASSIKLRK